MDLWPEMGGACVGVAVCSLNARHSFQPPSSSSSSRSYVDLASPRWGTALQTTLNSPKPFHQAYRCSETLDVHHRRLEDRKRPAISRGHCRHGHGFARQAHKANLNKANGKASNSAEDKAAGAKRVPQVRRQTCRHCTAPACCCGSPAARTQTLKVTPTAGVMWLRVKGGGVLEQEWGSWRRPLADLCTAMATALLRSLHPRQAPANRRQGPTKRLSLSISCRRFIANCGKESASRRPRNASRRSTTRQGLKTRAAHKWGHVN